MTTASISNNSQVSILFATICVSPADTSAFLAALRPVWDAVIAESENLFFEVTVDPQKPGQFRFIEAWTKDKKWIIEHQLTKAYYDPYIEKTKGMWTEERKLEIFERVPGWCAVKSEFLKDARHIWTDAD